MSRSETFEHLLFWQVIFIICADEREEKITMVTKNYAASIDSNEIPLTQTGVPTFKSNGDGSFRLYTGEIFEGSVVEAFAASKAAYANGEAPAPVEEPVTERTSPRTAASGAEFVRLSGNGKYYAPEAGRIFDTRGQAIRANEAAYARKNGSSKVEATDEPTHTTSGALRVKRNSDGTYYAPEARQRHQNFWDAVHTNEKAYAAKSA